jgi:hypothetical protein
MLPWRNGPASLAWFVWMFEEKQARAEYSLLERPFQGSIERLPCPSFPARDTC